MSEPNGPRPWRAVVLVGNPAAPYSRGLRIARALTAAGSTVEIAAVAGQDLPEVEHDGDVTIRRYAPSGPWAPMAATYQPLSTGVPVPVRRRRRPVQWALKIAAAARRWAFWPHTVRAWWTTLAADLAPADVYHACGSLTVAAALAARARDRRAGRSSVVVYDAIDDVVAGNNVLDMPRVVRALVARRERAWARSADGRTTVNEALAWSLAGRWGTEPPVVVPNWPERTLDPDLPRPDRIRAALSLPPTTRIVTFQGRLGKNLGLDQAADAVLEVPDAALCLIGFGRGYETSRARDRDSRFAGRHWTLPAVHPDELLEWTASADVSLVPLPPISANQRNSTPNKFWESIAAGTPIVVGPDLPVMVDLVRRYDLGAVAPSLSAADLAAALRAVLDVTDDEAGARRRRIAETARTHFAWDVAAERYRALVTSLRA